MAWLILSLLTALFASIKDLISKKILFDTEPVIIAFFSNFFMFLLNLPVLLYMGIPEFKPGFVPALLIAGTLLSFASIFYMKALKASDLSITVPILCFSPLFLLITSKLILQEETGPYGKLGVILIVGGSYLLNFQAFSLKHVFKPFASLIENNGSRLMLAVALIWSVTANVDKIGMIASSPVFWPTATLAYLSLFTGIYCLFFHSFASICETFRRHWGLILLSNLAGILLILCQMFALKLALVSYVVAIKRTSTAMCVIWGYLFLSEKNIKTKLIGVLIMLAGVFCIVAGNGI